MSTVLFGLFLVLAMSTVLFALVGINPKTEEYGWLPWAYSGASLIGSFICWLFSTRMSASLPPSPGEDD